jgi:hypothetical protein
MTQTRITAAHLYALRSKLSDRDLAIVESLAQVRLATTHHIQNLHFNLNVPRVCYRTLGRLTRLGILCRLSRQTELGHVGSAGYVYQLDRAGQILAGIRKRRIFQPRDYHYAFIDHTLALTDLYLRLKLANRDGAIKLAALDIESRCWRRRLKPDAYIQLVTGGFRYYWFIEMDMATQSPSKIRTKLTAYTDYWATGDEEQANRIFPKVLFLVPDEARKLVLECTIQQQSIRYRRLFRVALQSKALLILTGGQSL